MIYSDHFNDSQIYWFSLQHSCDETNQVHFSSGCNLLKWALRFWSAEPFIYEKSNMINCIDSTFCLCFAWSTLLLLTAEHTCIICLPPLQTFHTDQYLPSPIWMKILLFSGLLPPSGYFSKPMPPFVWYPSPISKPVLLSFRSNNMPMFYIQQFPEWLDTHAIKSIQLVDRQQFTLGKLSTVPAICNITFTNSYSWNVCEFF